ncbi:transposase [Sphingobium sp. JAI105]|uniref:transposase n=1 Tax=Sphingobium sp. JAI105 TaxID=2787715 RepID=UPI0018CA8456|nr:transposase [Sphingobium sp. JAI105]MBG6120989.1 transposase [Sphingobium sp. JAI105]
MSMLTPPQRPRAFLFRCRQQGRLPSALTIGLPERAPDALLADKGYDADAIRANLAERKIEAVIPGRSNRRVKIEHNRTLYKQRNRIERMFGHLKINRAIATRYDQLANSFLGMVHLATIRYWLKFVHAA